VITSAYLFIPTTTNLSNHELPMSPPTCSALMSRLVALILCCGVIFAAEQVSVTASKTSGVAVNETITVSLVLSGGAPLNAFQGYLEWDPTMLELSSSPTTTLVDGNGDPFIAAPGFVLATARAAGSGKRAFLSTAGEVIPTNTTLMTWTFKALAAGSTVVQTRQASPSDDFTKLSNVSGVSRYPAVGGASTAAWTAATPVTISNGSSDSGCGTGSLLGLLALGAAMIGFRPRRALSRSLNPGHARTDASSTPDGR
jgi:hypothetical protein